MTKFDNKNGGLPGVPGSYSISVVSRTEKVVARILALWILLQQQLAKPGTDPDEALDEFEAAALALVIFATVETFNVMTERVRDLWDIVQGPIVPEGIDPLLFDRDLVSGRLEIEQTIRNTVAQMRLRAKRATLLSTQDYRQQLVQVTQSRRSVYNLRSLLDEAVVSSAQHALWLQGLGAFEFKRVMGVTDKDQTGICRRLNRTLWRWEEMIVDPTTGASRMFPPFVGPAFDPTFHFCRSLIVPAIKELA